MFPPPPVQSNNKNYDAESDDNDAGPVASPSNVQQRPPFCELMNTPKPESQATKRAKDQADFQTKVMKLVDQEEDELSMTLSALGKKIKRSLQ